MPALSTIRTPGAPAGARGSPAAPVTADDGKAGGGSGVQVLVAAGSPTAPTASPTLGNRLYTEEESSRPHSPWESPEVRTLSFLKRASRRMRRSIYGLGQARESYYRDSVVVPEPEEDEEAAHGPWLRRAIAGLPTLRRRLLPDSWQRVIGALIDHPLWHLFILLITLFAVFAPDIAIATSAPDWVNNWINGFVLGIMGIFAAETVAQILCRANVFWLQVGLDLLSNLSLLFAVTWFTEWAGVRTDGTTSDAARACRVMRLVRVAAVAEELGSWLKQCYLRYSKKAGKDAGNGGDTLAPSNIGGRISEVTTAQVALVIVATVVGTSLLLGADTDTGGSEGLSAFTSAIAAAAGAGATEAQLQPTVDAMVTFAETQLERKQVPMLLEVAGVASWDFASQFGGWTERSTDRLDLAAASAGVQVSLAVNVAKANHLRALYNMALACMVIVLLLTFVVLFKYSIWKMLVQPLDRIFNTIRTNAAQVVAALGPETDKRNGGHGHAGSIASAGGRGDSNRASRKEDLDMHTIEAAVEKMSRILEQYTSTGGVGLNAVKKMAVTADQSTKEWLATMVAGPGSEEVANGRHPHAGTSGTSLTSSGGSSFTRAGGVQPRAAGPRGVSPVRKGPRLSRLGRLSETARTPQQPAALGQLAKMSPATGPQQAKARTSLGQFLERRSSSGYQHSQGSGSPGVAGLARANSGPQLAGGALTPKSIHSAESDAAALADLAATMTAQAPVRPDGIGGVDAWAGAGAGLPEEQRRLLAQVDLDYLHSFSFDALSLPPALLPAYLCAMFLELGLAFFSGDELEPTSGPGAGARGAEDEEAPFVDVATLWRFVDEVSRIYNDVIYHNFRHCCDVTHTTFMFIKRVGHKVTLAPLERLALMVAAISHDLDHPGVNNAYLVNARDQLAMTYNDSSVLENRHVACLYGQLLARPHLNILERLDPQQWKDVRKMLIGAILSTDMVHHFPMVSRLEVFYELHAGTIHAHHRALRQGQSRETLPRLFDSAEERQLLLNLLLHCADISNPVKPTEIAEKWSERVLGEFFAQGDRERSAGMPISPMCDRSKTSRAVSQINFIEFVVTPIYAQVYKIFPELGEVVDHLMANRHFWQDELMGELSAPLGSPVPGSGAPLTPELRAEEMAKAAKRLRDFQVKYSDILARRRHQLERLISISKGSRASLFAPGGNSILGHVQRQGSLMALMAEGSSTTYAATSAGALALASRSHSGVGGPGLMARLRTLTRSTRSGGRSSDASSAAEALEDVQADLAQRSAESSFSRPGWGGGSARVAPAPADTV